MDLIQMFINKSKEKELFPKTGSEIIGVTAKDTFVSK